MKDLSEYTPQQLYDGENKLYWKLVMLTDKRCTKGLSEEEERELTRVKAAHNEYCMEIQQRRA